MIIGVIESMELSKFQETAKAVRELGEGSSKVGNTSLGMVTQLIQVGITSIRGKKFLATFKAFIEVISVKLDMFRATNS